MPLEDPTPGFQMPPPKRGRPPKAPRVEEPPDPRPLVVQVEERWNFMRARDATIARLNGEIDKQDQVIRRAKQFQRLAQASIRTHEIWLRKEAAAYVASRAGIQHIPGFQPVEEGRGYRLRMRKKEREARAAALILLSARAEPKPETPTP